MKYVKAALVLILAIALFTGCAQNQQGSSSTSASPVLDRIQKRGELIVGTMGDMPPLNMTAKDGEIFGLEPGGRRLAAYVSATGSAGTVAAGDFLRTKHPHVKVVVAEALQCPTLYQLGFGGHRIEGIGDKHVPWIHNVRNTDMVCAIDDEQCMSLFRLFNESEGQEHLKRAVSDDLVNRLPLLGLSSICNP